MKKIFILALVAMFAGFAPANAQYFTHTGTPQAINLEIISDLVAIEVSKPANQGITFELIMTIVMVNSQGDQNPGGLSYNGWVSETYPESVFIADDGESAGFRSPEEAVQALFAAIHRIAWSNNVHGLDDYNLIVLMFGPFGELESKISQAKNVWQKKYGSPIDWPL